MYHSEQKCAHSLWRQQMGTFSCYWNSPFTGEFPSQRPVTQSFDVFFDLCWNKGLSKQSRCWWFKMPSCSLWCYCNIGSEFCIVGYGTGPLQDLWISSILYFVNNTLWFKKIRYFTEPLPIYLLWEHFLKSIKIELKCVCRISSEDNSSLIKVMACAITPSCYLDLLHDTIWRQWVRMS